MKTLSQIKKGLVVLVAFKLFLVGVALIVNSCQVETEDVFDNLEQETAITKFENLFNETVIELENTLNQKQNFISIKNHSSNKKIEELTKEKLNVIVDGTKELLLAFNLTDSDLLENFDDLTDPKIALLGLAILAQKKNHNQTAMKFINVVSQSAYAQFWRHFGHCAASAIGVDLAYSFISSEESSAWKRKKLKKLFKKVASRALGPVGVAITLIDFSICLSRSQ